MRLDVMPEGPLERLASWMGLVPTGVVKSVWGFSMARALVAAVDLGVFKTLGTGAMTAPELASALGTDEEGTAVLLGALTGFGMLRRRRGSFALSAQARRFLTDEKGTDLSAAVQLGALLDRKLEGLTEAIRTGQRQDFHQGLDDNDWEAYLRGLHGLARMTAKEIARRVQLPPGVPERPRRLLDVGGGHGGFSIALCEKYPDLTSEVLDLDGACRVGRAIVEQAGLSERVRYRAADARSAEWGEGHDAVLLFNILHNLPEADAEAAVRRAYQALRPGGLLAVLEGQHAGGQGDLSFQEAFGELLFYLLSHSKTWPVPKLSGWMSQAGFHRMRTRGMITLPGAVLLTGTRPSDQEGAT